MYLVTAQCDGPRQLKTPPARQCVAAMSQTAPDAEEAAVAARTLAQQATAGGWMTDSDELGGWFGELLFCPNCWKEWLTVTAPPEEGEGEQS